MNRKTDLIVQIQLKRLDNGLDVDDCRDSTSGYRRKTIAQLEELLRVEVEVAEMLLRAVEFEMDGD